MASIRTFDELVSLVPEAWRTEAVLAALANVEPSVFETEHRPHAEDIFRALTFFKPSETKVIILGQDPYYQPGKANGLAFGVDAGYAGEALAGSLGNIATAIHRQTKKTLRDHTLESWAAQGVLLLNRVLTVGSVPMSHANHGWEDVTRHLVLEAAKAKPVAMLWGSQARTAAVPLRKMGCKVYETSHPSPMSAHLGFLDCPQFGETAQLIKWGV